MTTRIISTVPRNLGDRVRTILPAPFHPLDPLSAEEIKFASSLIKEHLNNFELQFAQLNLYEPHKELVSLFERAHERKPYVKRQAFAIVLDKKTGRTYELITWLNPQEGKPRVVSCIHIPGVQPNILTTEYRACEDLVRSDPQVVAALKRRGINDPNLVNVELWSGFFSDPKDRIANPLLYLRTDDETNPYSRPIEGFEVRVDLNKMKVVDVKELMDLPIPPHDPIAKFKNLDYRKDVKPLDVIQPEGPSFQVDGQVVTWQNWQFRVGFTETEGLVLHQISFLDKGKRRPIIFRASCVEMVVPYGDPRSPNHLKNAFDAGEDGLGRNANSLELGCDCLGSIYYFDATLCDAQGDPYVIKNAICMHEEDNGIMWKHKDWRSGEAEVRRSRKLIVSFFTTISNYDYGFYWYFLQDGTIKFEAKLTGILSTSAIHDGQHPGGYGTMIAPNLYAPIHQHFFTARLDMQIDGDNNSVQEVNVKRPDPNEPNPYKSAFYATYKPLKTELEALRNASPSEARFWIIHNPSSKNRVGTPCSFKLMCHNGLVPFAMDESKIINRAGYLKHALIVTPYNPHERYPSGNYPFQKEVKDGLTEWTKQNRNIDNTDIVVWHTFGVTHVCRAEDWPIMPAEFCGFTLKPFNFFDANPAIDLPKPAKVEDKHCCSPKAKL